MEELRPLIAEGQEKGSLSFEQIASCLEEIEVTKEQVQELHAHLIEQGIEVVGADGRPATSEAGRVEAAAEARRANAAGAGGSADGDDGAKKPEIDLTVEP